MSSRRLTATETFLPAYVPVVGSVAGRKSQRPEPCWRQSSCRAAQRRLVATRKGERVVGIQVGERAPSEEAAEACAEAPVARLHGGAGDSAATDHRGVAVEVRVQRPRTSAIGTYSLMMNRPTSWMMLWNWCSGRQYLGAVVGHAATNVARGHRHTACEERAGLKREATDLESTHVADDDSVPDVTVGGVRHVGPCPTGTSSIAALSLFCRRRRSSCRRSTGSTAAWPGPERSSEPQGDRSA